MRLTSKLLGFLNKPFSRDPEAFLALRLRYLGGTMQWTVADGVLTTVVTGGPGVNLSIDLSQHTVASLAGVLSLAAGYLVPYVAGAAQNGASALRLLDGTGDQMASNGDHITAYGSILQAWIDACAVELDLAEQAINALPSEMNTATADGEWLDFQGSMYAVERIPGEPDRQYGSRIITEVLRPLSNNVAIEAAILDYTGSNVSIVDVVFFRSPEPAFDGIPRFDGSYAFNPTAAAVYGLFDCYLGYDLVNGGVPTAFEASVRALVERVRAAGTQLRTITLTDSALTDTVNRPYDGMDLSVDSMDILHARRFDGSYAFDGSNLFSGNYRERGTIEATLQILAETSPFELRVLVGGRPFLVEVHGTDLSTFGVALLVDTLKIPPG